MVLVLNGAIQDDCPRNTSSVFLQQPVYIDYAQQLHSIPPKSVSFVGLLFVGQREMATVARHDKDVNIIGSDDATTCIIVVVRHSGSGAVALAHFDGMGVNEAVCTMVVRVQELSLGYPDGRLELHLIGGYGDRRGYAEDIFYGIMQSFHKHRLHFDLKQACVGELNTILRGDIKYPIVYGVGVNIKTGVIFPASFTDRGPDRQLRDARTFMGARTVLDIYDPTLGILRIKPFNYDPLRGVDLWLSQSDEYLLRHFSTSPEVEPPHFANQTRATIKFIQEHQCPAKSIFGDNLPRNYKRSEITGCWTLVKY